MANILQKVQLPIVSDEGECNSQSFEFHHNHQNHHQIAGQYMVRSVSQHQWFALDGLRGAGTLVRWSA